MQVIVILHVKILLYVLSKNGKENTRLTTPRWWGKMIRRVEERVVRECSLNVDSTKVHKQRFVLPKHHSKYLCSCQSDLNQKLELGLSIICGKLVLGLGRVHACKGDIYTSLGVF